MKTLLLLIIMLVCAGLNEAIGQWTTSGSNIFNSNTGNVGIGNSAPSTLLHVGRNMTEPSITIQNFGGTGGATYTMIDNSSGANWKFKATNTGGFKIRDHANLMDVVVIEPSSLANALYIKTGGNVGIGTANPTSKFHVLGNILSENGTITINNPTAILQLQSAGVSKGFMQLSGNNLRIGTNSGNTVGKLIIRMNGQEHVTVDSAGNVGIGTSTPESKLNVTGGAGVSYTLNGQVQLGSTSEINTVLGRNEILTRFQGGPSTFFLQQNGGKIIIGGAGSPENPKVQILEGSTANLTTNDGYLMLGSSGGVNIAISNSEILSRFNGVAAPLYLQQEGGAVRLGATGGTAVGTKLHITDGANAGLTTHGFLLIGLTTAENIVMDNNNIQSRNNGVADYLKVQQSGGPGLQVGFFNTASHPLSKLYIPAGDDAGVGSDGFIHLGLINSTNLILDNNEIMARNDGALSTLYLQNDGGSVQIGAHTTINTGGNGEVLRLDGVNPNIGFYQSNVYRSFISQSGTELFMGVNGGKMHLDASQIAIGTVSTLADAYKLTVSGKILCEEVKVELYANWPDYVFDEDYELTSLYDLKSYISDHNHLPDIPTAEVIAKEGLEIGEMNRKLLEKVEELTLYVIQLQEQIDELKEDQDK